jgi:hypothetical protein
VWAPLLLLVLALSSPECEVKVRAVSKLKKNLHLCRRRGDVNKIAAAVAIE